MRPESARATGEWAPFLDHVWKLGSKLQPPVEPALPISFLCPAPGPGLLQSLEAQTGGLWELAADAQAARGRWLCPIRPGDRLAPHAVAVVSAALSKAVEAQQAFTDTVRTDEDGTVGEVELKPGYDPVLEQSRPYARELLLFHRDLHERPHRPLHIPYPALITSAPPLELAFRPDPPPALPAISVIIPSRDRPDLIRTVLRGVMELTDYAPLEVIVVDNGSTDPQVLDEYRRREPQGLRVIRQEGPFNFSRLINCGVERAMGAGFLLLNNDVEITSSGWLREMVACLSLPGTGVVGARLMFPDGNLQHAGVICGLDRGHAGHWYAGEPADTPGVLGRLQHPGSFSAVTAACMLISRSCWQAVGGFDEKAFAVAYNDVDFCLRAGDAGFGAIWTPYAELIHREKSSRRHRKPAELIRFWSERRALRARHATHGAGDPAFSPWLSLDGPVPVPRRLGALPSPRTFRMTAAMPPHCRPDP